MTWALLAEIIAREGFEFARKLWENWKAGGVPTDAQWEALAQIRTKEQVLAEARARAGLNP